ncbi:MAG TPA: VCBS repeat-containing protein [Steroidobacteraceae bacterium]|nr:VCBS repeat-containing protein [Steroidobacteraceae bacterium]
MNGQFSGARVGILAALVAGLTGCGGDNGVSRFDVPNSLVITDLNGDSAPDIAVATTSVADDGSQPSPGFASVFLQSTSSPGSFATGKHYDTDNNPSSIAAGDLTGTGTTDLVVANFAAGDVSVLLQTSPGSGQYQSAMNVATGGNPNDVVIADVNGDGRNDLVAADDAATGRVVILLQDPASAAHFLPPVALATTNPASGVAVGDLDGDGKPDIAAATSDTNGNNGAIVIFYQDPANPGSFLAPVRFAGGAQPTAVKIADLNADGLPDLAVANLGPGTDGTGASGATVLLQDATHPGSFLAPVTYSAQSGTIHIVVADMNGDQKPDLVTANIGPAPTGSVSVLMQDPTRPGVFQAAQSFAGFGQPLAVAVGDLNNDGIPDVAVADGSTATVMYQGTTPGTFPTIGQLN